MLLGGGRTMHSMNLGRWATGLLVAGAATSIVAAAEPRASEPVREFRVRYHEAAALERFRGAQRAADLSAAAKEPLAHVRTDADGSHHVRAGRGLARREAWAVAARLATAPGVARVEPVDPAFGARPPARPTRAGGTR